MDIEFDYDIDFISIPALNEMQNMGTTIWNVSYAINLCRLSGRDPDDWIKEIFRKAQCLQTTERTATADSSGRVTSAKNSFLQKQIDIDMIIKRQSNISYMKINKIKALMSKGEYEDWLGNSRNDYLNSLFWFGDLKKADLVLANDISKSLKEIVILSIIEIVVPPRISAGIKKIIDYVSSSS